MVYALGAAANQFICGGAAFFMPIWGLLVFL
jgi:hypothetical protein